MEHTYIYGLIGYPLGHSFSKKYFSKKFEKEGLPCQYELFELPDIQELPALLRQQPNLKGLNVTIPHKRSVIPFLDALSPEAQAIGAVNVIHVQDGLLKGHNSDVFGFEKSFFKEDFFGKAFFEKTPSPQALILGTGGAAAAAAFVFKQKGIPYKQVSRQKDASHSNIISYNDLNDKRLGDFHLIVNATPLGTYPNVGEAPPLPWEGIGPQHFLFDMVYNPAETLFIMHGLARGARTKNGLEMLHLQAEKAWEIFRIN